MDWIQAVIDLSTWSHIASIGAFVVAILQYLVPRR